MTVPEESWKRFAIEFIWKPTSFNRMKKGLRIFIHDPKSISSYLFYKILGKQQSHKSKRKGKVPKNLSIEGLPELNIYQTEAIKKCLEGCYNDYTKVGTSLSLIQGPPGTGKTVVSATLVFHLVNTTRKKVLVCAPSNIAVDHLADKVSKTGLRVVRLCARSRETIDSRVDALTLHQLVKTSRNPACERLRKFVAQGEETKFSPERERKYIMLKAKAEKAILNEADVVCVT